MSVDIRSEMERHRHEIMGELKKRGGLVEPNQGGIVCPYCHNDFYTVIKRDVLEEVLNEPRTKSGNRRPWEW